MSPSRNIAQLGSLFAICISFYLGSSAFGGPISYISTFKPGPIVSDIHGVGDPLGLVGATVTITETWDAVPLAPVFDGPAFGGRATVWPVTNTTASVSIAGSTGGADGSYVGTLEAGDDWQLGDNTTDLSGDFVQFPHVDITALGVHVVFGGETVSFLPSFNTPPSPGSVLPFEYANSDIARLQPPFTEDNFVGPTGVLLGNGAGFVSQSEFEPSPTAVPEPSSLALLSGIAGAAWPAFRRRRTWRSASSYVGS